MTGVVVCHGSPAVRERLVAAAQGVPALTPVRAAASGEELLLLARRQAPSMVLLDAHLPGTGPVEAMRRLRLMNIGSAVVMLAQPGDEIALDRAVALGARGFVAPDVGRSELAAVAAHVLVAGAGPRTGLPTRLPAVPAPANGSARRLGGSTVGAGVGAVRAVAPAAREREVESATVQVPKPELTKREIEVLTGMSNGRSNAQIGADLFLSEDTVKTHARRLFRKLGAADRAQAVAIGLRRGLIR
ncbi:response regulator transcription factor [Cellulomonas sp. ATA003]|uniref:response regulator transcription factor n=1 Tax=Cellulomonas sp. ATA003 TaxID=3073064 RepID=UPI0028735035|nr:response regulator transcription factor [Cellulomonas sp. ATA003]WNB86047.1 response regulator transcription factor [Cellulomonas sp. ATA003]